MGRKPANAAVYNHHDGRQLAAPLEFVGGVWRINLTKHGGGRVVLRRPGTTLTLTHPVADLGHARSLGQDLLKSTLLERESRPAASSVSEEEEVAQYIDAQQAGQRPEMTPHTAAAAEYAIHLCMGKLRDMGIVSVREFRRQHITGLVARLRAHPTMRGGLPADATVRKWMMYFSGYISDLVDNDLLESNPLSRHKRVPKLLRATKREALEPSQARALLSAAFRLVSVRSPHFPYILAILLYTGMRLKECLGLLVSDVRFAEGEISVEWHPHRRVKNRPSVRKVKLWPALTRILETYLKEFKPPADGLLFPRPGQRHLGKQGTLRMWTSLRGSMHIAVREAGITDKHVTLHVLRHTYCSVRLQIVERDKNGDLAAAVPLEVAKELGHAGTAMVDYFYGHQLKERFRHETLDYDLADEPTPSPAPA